MTDWLTLFASREQKWVYPIVITGRVVISETESLYHIISTQMLSMIALVYGSVIIDSGKANTSCHFVGIVYE